MDFKNGKKPDKARFSVPQDQPQPKSWLDEEDEWDKLRSDTYDSPKNAKRRFGKKDSSAFDEPDEEAEKVQVNINVSLPKLRVTKRLGPIFTKLHLGRYYTKAKGFLKVRRNAYITGGVVGAVVVLGIVGIVISKQGSSSGSPEVAGTATGSQSAPTPNELPREKPSFKILYPGGKNDETVGEIVRISPDGKPPAYTYVDKISDTQINITQQELPDRFKENSDGELEKLATDNYQKDVIQVDGTKVYHGKSTSGIQSLVFIKGNLLITIKAFEVISDELWAAYISAMHS